MQGGCIALTMKRANKLCRRANQQKPVQPSAKKFSAFLSRQINRLYAASRSTGGAARDRHEARGGMRWTRLARLTSGAEADGEVVWSGRVEVKLARVLSASRRRW